ncbi:diguanylate cyclase [Epibacterium sp. SM1969]|uniref:Diguanylate cyclase n=1 Tax=Tritonibacter aquimaris TaxID=2663379 RepID=A0A844AKF8_9RHOB|nr:PAS-domain containing protein [Tritonibacter aquimaris]MQY41835.1 diguanylate cyclase [Tritonibacter aquimaris]
MQDIVSVEWLVLAALCTATAALAVKWLSPTQQPKRMEHDLLIGDGRTDAVFLFDDTTLIGWSSGARKFIGEHAEEFSWSKLRDQLARSYPGLPQSPSFLKDVGPLVLSGTEGADSREAHCEWIDGVIRVQLRRSTLEEQNKSLDQELTTLRAAVHQAPYPVWLQSEEGDVTWTNLAYDDLSHKIHGRDVDMVEPMFAELDEPKSSGRPERTSITLPDSDKKLWYNVSTTETEAGWLCHAVDVNAVVDAEIAQRNFVQTLAKTFAQLSIGLAIFDRNQQLVLFNPVLIDLTALPASFLSSRPDMLTFFDRLRDQRMMPEPKNYTSWRHQMADLLEAAAEGRYQETWSMPSGSVYSVSGRPHPDGAIAFLFEDITAEITLTRQFRTELEVGQSIMDQMEEAIAVFNKDGTMSFSNEAYHALWNVDPEASFAKTSIIDACRIWQDVTVATSAWGAVRDFVLGTEDRNPWWSTIQLRSGETLTCRVCALPNGTTLIRFHPQDPVTLPPEEQKFLPNSATE